MEMMSHQLEVMVNMHHYLRHFTPFMKCRLGTSTNHHFSLRKVCSSNMQPSTRIAPWAFGLLSLVILIQQPGQHLDSFQWALIRGNVGLPSWCIGIDVNGGPITKAKHKQQHSTTSQQHCLACNYECNRHNIRKHTLWRCRGQWWWRFGVQTWCRWQRRWWCRVCNGNGR